MARKRLLCQKRNMTKNQAAEILATNKLGLESTSVEGTDIIIDQISLPGVEVDINTKIQLISQEDLKMMKGRLLYLMF